MGGGEAGTASASATHLPAAAAAAVASAPPLASDCLYAVDWRVSAPVLSPPSSRRQASHRSLYLCTPTKTCTLGGGDAGPATSAAARAVAAAVRAGLPSAAATLVSTGGAAVQAAVTSPCPLLASLPRLTAAAAAAAVLRVAAAESPSTRWSVVDANAARSGSSPTPLDAARPAAELAAVSGGAMFEPRLLRTPPPRRRTKAAPTGADPFGCASVVSGGRARSAPCSACGWPRPRRPPGSPCSAAQGEPAWPTVRPCAWRPGRSHRPPSFAWPGRTRAPGPRPGGAWWPRPPTPAWPASSTRAPSWTRPSCPTPP